MDLWTLAAERAAKWWAGKGGRDSDWREWVGVAWEGIAMREASRIRRGLPPLDDRQVHLAARSALVDEARKGAGGFGKARGHDGPLLRTESVFEDDFQLSDWVPDRAFVVVPGAVNRVKYRWSAVELRALRKALRAGATAPEIASGMGRTRYGVQRKRLELDLGAGRTGRPPDHGKRSELVRLLGEGLSLNAVARQRGVVPNTVRMTAHRLVAEGRLVRVGGPGGLGRYVPATGGVS